MPDLEQDFPGREVCWNGKRKEENYVRKKKRNYSRTITEETSFKEDLGADSLDLFEMVMAFEEAFEVEIPSEDLEQIQTVGDVVKYLEAHK